MNIKELQYILFKNYQYGCISDAELVQIIELASGYLNLRTVTNYAKANKITYNGALKRSTQSVTIDHVKFIIDNE
jgi:hypothetical protein